MLRLYGRTWQLPKSVQQLYVTRKTIQLWDKTYQKHGQEAFIHKPNSRSYTKEFKEEVVQEYIQGTGTVFDLAIKYHLSVSTISKWIQVYYYGGEQNAYEPNGVVYTMK